MALPAALAGEHDVIVLAGGRGERLGGVDKAGVLIAGRSMLERVLGAVAGARQVVVVGVERGTDREVTWTREDPPGGGPVAGIVAGLGALADPAARVLVLAVDQPGVAEAVPALLRAGTDGLEGADGACPHDEDGYPQWLLACYRTAALQRAARRVGDGRDVSVRTLVRDLVLRDVPEARGWAGDVDTWDDAHQWEQRLREQKER